MARNGSGTYALYTPGNPVVTGTTISSAAQNNTLNDIATALTLSIAADGQTPITANIPMASHKLTGLSAATTSGDALAYAQASASLASLLVTTTTGPALTVSSRAVLDAPTNATQFQTVSVAAATIGYFGSELGVAGTGTNAFGLRAENGFFLSVGGATKWMTVSTNRNGAISAPVSGVALAVTGFANSAGVSSSTGISVGNAANTDATVLDYYGENTFTPSIDLTGAPTITTQVGNYTRIGRAVDFMISLVWTGGTNGASFGVTGLPFASAASLQLVNIYVNRANASFTWTGQVQAYTNGSTSIVIEVNNTGSSAASFLNPNAGTKDMILSGTYYV